MSDDTQGFVSLKALRQDQPDSERALAEIRRIYFKTTRQTIEHDLAHAIELLKSIPNEEDRERARVYMDGLSQMRGEWGARKQGRRGKGEGGRGKKARK